MNKTIDHYESDKPSEFSIPGSDLYQRFLEFAADDTGPVNVGRVVGYDGPQGYKGKFDLWSPRPGCLVAILDFTALEQFTTSTPLENYYSIEIITRGSSEIQLGDRSFSNNGKPRVYLCSHGSQSCKKRGLEKGDAVRSIGIWIRPTLFLETFGIEESSLPDDLRTLFLNPDNGVLTFPVTTPVSRISDEIFDTRFTGKRAEEHLRAKLTELLCHIAEIATNPTNQIIDDVALPRGKSNVLKRILSVLESSSLQSLSLRELADELNLCQSTLSTIFKEGYGMKLSDYLLQRKMERACALLSEGKLSVFEVALEVGYENQSSFGRAYRRYFNRTPKEDIPKP